MDFYGFLWGYFLYICRRPPSPWSYPIIRLVSLMSWSLIIWTNPFIFKFGIFFSTLASIVLLLSSELIEWYHYLRYYKHFLNDLFFFKETPTPDIYTLSLQYSLPISIAILGIVYCFNVYFILTKLEQKIMIFKGVINFFVK